MKELKQFKNLYPTTQLMIVSLVLGTFLLFLHILFPKSITIIFIGYFYVMVSVLINLFAAIILVIQLFLNLKEYEIYVIRLLILLANIPIAALYFYITIITF